MKMKRSATLLAIVLCGGLAAYGALRLYASAQQPVDDFRDAAASTDTVSARPVILAAGFGLGGVPIGEPISLPARPGRRLARLDK